MGRCSSREFYVNPKSMGPGKSFTGVQRFGINLRYIKHTIDYCGI